MRRPLIVALGLMLAGGTATSVAAPAIVIGAVYPTSGSQGTGGVEEFRGVELAAAYVSQRGGVNGRPVRIQLADASSYDAAPGAVEQLAKAGITVVVGSYGSTISRPAAEAASRLGLVFWETGAVGQLAMGAATSNLVFRVAPTGGTLGQAAVAFVRDELAARLHRARPLQYGVAYVDDVYGRSVGLGALAEVQRSRLPLAGAFPYQLRGLGYPELAARIAGARTDVLVVGAYLEDGAELRRALVNARVPLIVNIGTSSSYCMPAFGRLLGQGAVGVFASDKPDGDVLRPERLSREAGQALRWARAEYRRRYKESVSAPTLAGFAGGLALFQHVLPRARDSSAEAVARAAREVRLPEGALPNGGGLAFGPAGTPDGSTNLRATSVIWEWVGVNTRAVVWPPAFATHPIAFP
jgi:branched-chain amino acid transport system substrate-binding protein